MSAAPQEQRSDGCVVALELRIGDRTLSGEPCPRTKIEARYAILVVEDEVLVRMVIADRLRDAGFTVIEASDAREALEVLRLSTVSIRLVLSDIRMPGATDGCGLARIVRSEYPMIKIVLTSGHVSTLSEVEHDGFFRKPYLETQLVNHIKALLD